jgi:cation diffusion facilitator CzcD-associated flavoprotein CzcO
MPEPGSSVRMRQEDLEALTARARRDLELIAHPRAQWLEPRPAPDGSPALDVLIVGAGQGGAAVAFALMRAQVTNILVVDKAAEGREGPWLTYARMRTLRSPKDYTGPDLDVPSLTYRAWHEARFGADSWEDLELIPRELWAEYLRWVRKVSGVPVRNETEVVDISAAAGGLLAVSVVLAGGRRATLYARKVVLATGQEGTGRWWMPEFVERLPPRLRAHAADAIDFAALEGKVVGVLGAGASALDNAAVALEHGACEVHLFCRRPAAQVVQPYRWLTFSGFLRHLSDLDDAWRWRFMATILGLREGFPQETYDRCARHANFTMHTGTAWLSARADGARAEVETSHGPFTADFLICGTGIDIDFALRPELAQCAANIATWGDRYTPPEAERDERLARYPYLAPDYSFTEKVPGRTPWIRDLHLFAIGATMSFGPSGSSINAMTTAVSKLVHGITRALFTADVERHWASLKAYDVPQAVLRPPQDRGD